MNTVQRFSCHNCGKHLSYQITQYGMRIKCPKCQQSLRVGMTTDSDGGAGGSFLAQLADRRVLGMLAVIAVIAAVVVWRLWL